MIHAYDPGTRWSEHMRPRVFVKPIASEYKLYTAVANFTTYGYDFPAAIQPLVSVNPAFSTSLRKPLAVYSIGNGLGANICYHKGNYVNACLVQHNGGTSGYGLYPTTDAWTLIHKGPDFNSTNVGELLQVRAGAIGDGSSAYPAVIRCRSGFVLPDGCQTTLTCAMLIAAREVTAGRINGIAMALGKGTGSRSSFARFEKHGSRAAFGIDPSLTDLDPFECIYQLPHQVTISGETMYLYVVLCYMHTISILGAISTSEVGDKAMLGLSFSQKPSNSDFVHILNMLIGF